jgi:hypothetical protein
MAPSATSFLDGAAVDRFFGWPNDYLQNPPTLVLLNTDAFVVAGAVRDHAFMVSSEISQVPHSGVLRLLRTARFVLVLAFLYCYVIC